jgi:hypothetical protein
MDLIAIYLDINSYNYSYSIHRYTTRKPETCLLVRYHFTSYLSLSSCVTLVCICVNCLSTVSSLLTVPICVCISLK